MTGQSQSSSGNNGSRIQSQAARTVKPKRGASSAPPPGPRPAPRKRSRAPFVIGAVLCGTLAVGLGWGYRTLNNISGGKAPEAFGGIVNPRGQFPDQNRVNILLIGYDYSYDWGARGKLNGMPYTKESRSDSIVMLSLDLDTKKISTLSIPRDTWVTAPDGKTGKINATFKRGGVELLAGTVTKLLGVKPDYYIAVQPKSVKTIVDELGGVEVEAIDKMVYNDDTANLHINLPKGRQVINGEQAIGFSRYREPDVYEVGPDGRHIYTGRKDRDGNPIFVRRRRPETSLEDGDQRRMARQRQLMQAMAAKGKTPANLARIENLINISLGALKTDLDRPQIFALASLFRNTPPDQIQSAALVTHAEMRSSVGGRTYTEQVDERKKDALVAWLLKGDEAAANRFTVVSVQNGTEISGAAGRVADLLKEKGFTARAGNAEKNNSEVTATRIVYGKAMFAPRAEKIKQILGGGTLVKEPRASGVASGGGDEDTPDVTIVLGRDVAAQFGQRSASR